MEQIVVKTEVQSNGEILLYYVDDNGDNQEGVLTTIENIESDSIQLQDASSYILGSYDDLVNVSQPLQAHIEELPDSWSNDEINRLLIFYNDNKTSFISGATKKKHLWTVACKTMLIGKNQQSCEEKLAELKSKYSELHSYISKGIYVKWQFLDLCHQAFHDDPSLVEAMNDENSQAEEIQDEESNVPKLRISELNQETIKPADNILAIKQVNTRSADKEVELMLNLYLKYKDNFKKDHWRRDLWEKIGQEMGGENGEYLQKRFLNHKQHYITMLEKRKELGNSKITWPYMELFDQIFGDDVNFHKKYFNQLPEGLVDLSAAEHEWNIAQKTILAKYYFDCYDEFQDETIPEKFLWSEIGRLLDKHPETCQIRYQMLRKEHLEQYITGGYSLQKRVPVAIIFDNIIAKDVRAKLCKTANKKSDMLGTNDSDQLVQFIHTNTELFKDKECYFVCFEAIAQKLKRKVESCKREWDDLVTLYNSILEEKKEDPDLLIDWKHIDLFDQIFDYGMDSELLKGYYVAPPITTDNVTGKKANTKQDETDSQSAVEEIEEPEVIPNINVPRTDSRTPKILEHYYRNKDKLKTSIWEMLADKIGMTPTECAHRLRSLRQTYIEYVRKEVEQPRTLISWPYYTLCKKVFGYRAIKNKIKQGQLAECDDWLAREIKLLISFFSKHFHEINNNIEDVSVWLPLATELDRTVTNCKDKFVELRKSYKKLKAMKAKNPDVKISWSYFNMFERIYDTKDVKDDDQEMEVEKLEEEHLIPEEMEVEDDDYECIIVLQDGQNLPENTKVLDNTVFIEQLTDLPQLQNTTDAVSNNTKWTKRSKKRLLIFYINYIRLHRGKEISGKDMWTEIATKIPNKTPGECRRMLIKMKRSYKRANEIVKKNSPFSFLLEKVLKLKPMFAKSDKIMKQQENWKDVPMASDKVYSALQYYLEHIEEFVNPQFEQKYLWAQLANHISEPVTKVYNKVNYLKQAYNMETEEIAGVKTEFSAFLKEIIAKEVAVNIVLETNVSPEYNEQESTWTDDETEQLMIWYLSNLEKFKNPKFNKSYLWLEASGLLVKSPVSCSKKMSEVRTQYRNMVKENADDLHEWRFFGLCQKIYGTGKKTNANEL